MNCVCPRCEAELRLANSIRAGKRIACPSCRAVFRIRPDPSRAAPVNTSLPTPVAPPAEPRPEPPARSFRPRRFKPKEKSVNPALIVLPIAVVSVLLLGGMVVAVILVRNKDKDSSVAKASTTSSKRDNTNSNPPVSGFSGFRPEPNNTGGLGQPGPGSPGQPDNPPWREPTFPQLPQPQPPQPIPGPPPSAPPPVPSEPVAGTEVGNLAREIEGEDIDRKKFKLSDYKGKVILLDFWGFW
ncbi:MAG: hypothetical protein ACJ8FY_08635 [Gemmataceae bacterium]